VRAPLPTHVESLLPAGFVLPPELERNAYFIAAEALTNVAKHAAAENAWVRLELRPDEAGGSRAGSTSSSPTTGWAAHRPRRATASPVSRSGCAASGVRSSS